MKEINNIIKGSLDNNFFKIWFIKYYRIQLKYWMKLLFGQRFLEIVVFNGRDKVIKIKKVEEVYYSQ